MISVPDLLDFRRDARFLLFFVTVFLNASILNAQSFDYPDFSTTENLNVFGYSRVISKQLRLTPAQTGQRGSMWYTGSKVNVAEGFETHFAFRISASGGAGGGADGIAFIIQNDSKPEGLGTLGGGMGYNGIPNSLAIEFDTYDNGEGGNNHVSIQTKGRLPNATGSEGSIKANHRLPLNLKSGSVINARIISRKGQFWVYLNGILVLDAYYPMAENLDLDQGKAWIGFSSATGAGFSNHDILSWYLIQDKDNPNPTPEGQDIPSDRPIGAAPPIPTSPGHVPVEIDLTEVFTKIFNNANRDEKREIRKKNREEKKRKQKEIKYAEAEREPSLPTHIKNRPVQYIDTIEVHHRRVKLALRDTQIEDGDKASVNLNGEWVARRKRVSKRTKEYVVRLKRGKNYLALHAHNLGRIPPNTATVILRDGPFYKPITLRSTKDRSQAIIFTWQGK